MVGEPVGLCVRWLFVYISDILYQVEQCSGILFEVADVFDFIFHGVSWADPGVILLIFHPDSQACSSGHVFGLFPMSRPGFWYLSGGPSHVGSGIRDHLV